ncbi:MFS transporter [Oceanobacillus luteolus]|nr:MFS transporter [Oceanobacillus luteolus]
MVIQQSTTPLKLLLFSFHASNTILISFLPLYLQYQGLSGTEIGWILATGPLASIFAQPFWGYLSDKFKTVKWILFICILGLLIGAIIFFQMKTIVSLVIIGALFFFFSTPIGGLSDSLAQRRADELRISFGSIRMWGSVGFAAASLSIGVLLNQFGIQYIHWPYLLFGTIALIVIIQLKDVSVDRTPVKLGDVKQIIMNKPLMLFFLFILFITISHRTNDSYLGIYIMELGGSESLVGIAWFIGVLMEAIVFATASKWFKKYHTIVFIIFAGIIYSIRWVMYAWFDDPLMIVIFQFMHGITFGVFYVAAFEYITRLIPKFLQSTGHMLFYAIFFGISGIVGSLMGGRIIELFSGEFLYLCMAGLSLVGVLLVTIYHVFTTKAKRSRTSF